MGKVLTVGRQVPWRAVQGMTGARRSYVQATAERRNTQKAPAGREKTGGERMPEALFPVT